MLDGIVNVFKPAGVTSADVVRWIRRNIKTDKVGHIGTLDPEASGVLPVCLGKATRLAEYYSNQRKRYRAEITLGIVTDTQDSSGKEISRSVPEVSCEEFAAELKKFVGKVKQIPPMFSAVRKHGRHLYEYARKGLEVEREEREIIVYSLALVEWIEGLYPKAVLDIECSKGTYIRTLCHDLGTELGCGAHMSNLLRMASGEFKLEDSKTLEEIEKCLASNDFSFVYNMGWGLDLPAVDMPENRLEAFKNGLPTKIRGNIQDNLNPVQVYCCERFIGIGTWKDGNLYPKKVLV